MSRLSSATSSKLWVAAVGLLLSSISTFSMAEIRSFDGPIEAAASYIHYSEGFIATPGYVDIGNLVFSTIDDDEEKDESSQVEIILFHEPKNCSKVGEECDWAGLGVGGEDENGDLRWCCWEDAIDLGLCQGRSEEYGKMILDPNKFKGEYRSINVPGKGHQDLHVKFGKMEVEGPTGKYVLVMSNCNVEGRDLRASGQYVWMSEHGYLPGDLFGEMYFYVVMTILYAILFSSYGLKMKIHEASRIPIQNYILLTIGIGFAEVFFRAGDYWVWNEDGTRFWFAMYTGIFMGVFKRSISRCLIVMVSLGWGVVRDDLSGHLRKIYIIGALYFGTSTATDILKVFSIVENETLGPMVEEELFDVVAIMTFVVAAIDVYFYMWILDSLGGTMQYLEEMNQHMKLQRYLRLRMVFLLSVLFAIVWAVFGIVNSYMTGPMLEEKHQWGVQGAWELNYFMVLASVSYLWKPDPNAKEYAYVMELPSMADNDDHDLNFATNAGVQEDDDDDVDVKERDSIHDRIDGEEDDVQIPPVKQKGLQIDDGVEA